MYSLINGIAKHALSSFMSTQDDSKELPCYKKDLVYKLMCSHQNQFNLLVELRLTAQQFDHTRARRFLRMLSKIHCMQLNTEQTELYPLIRANHSNADELSAQIDDIHISATTAANDIKTFCSIWYQQLENMDNLKQFSLALEPFGEMLDKLITKKEMKLYPLYNQSSVKNSPRAGYIYNG